MTIADKNTQGLMGPEQAKKLAKALTTDAGQVLTSPTINGGALSGAFSGVHVYSSALKSSIGTSTTVASYWFAEPTDYGLGKPRVYLNKLATATDYELGVSDGTTAGNLNIAVATFSLNSSPVMTRGASETITGLKTISLGTATAQLEYLKLATTDTGAGKPYLSINKPAQADAWTIGLWNGTDATGIINFNCSVLNKQGVELATVAGPIFTLPPRLPSYTVATVPAAATYVRGQIYVSDGTSNKRLAISDGTNWRFPDGAIVS